MSKRGRIVPRVATVTAAAALFAAGMMGCGGGEDAGGDNASDAAAREASGPWSLAAAAEKFKGSSIRILDESSGPQGPQEVMKKLIPEFERETGIDVEYEQLGHVDVIRRGEADLYSGRGHYDAVMFHSGQYPGALEANAVEYIDKYLEDPALRDPSLDFDKFVQPQTDSLTLVDGKRAGFLNWDYVQMLWARKDLIEHPEEKRDFKAKYGYDLAVPETLQQMVDYAEFFTRPAGATLAGKKLTKPIYGFSLDGSRIGVMYLEVWENFMRNMCGDLYDKSGNPTAASPQNQRALELWTSLWKFAPPNTAEISFIEFPVVQGQGIAASGFGWADFVAPTDSKKGSPLAGNFVYAPVPYDGENESCRATVAEPSGLVISAASKNKEATYLFLQWLVSEDTQRSWLQTAHGGGATPVLVDMFEDPVITESPHAQMYAAIAKSHQYGRARPRLKSINKITNAVTLRAQAMGRGETNVQDGLAALQKDLEEICKSDCFVKTD